MWGDHVTFLFINGYFFLVHLHLCRGDVVPFRFLLLFIPLYRNFPALFILSFFIVTPIGSTLRAGITLYNFCLLSFILSFLHYSFLFHFYIISHIHYFCFFSFFSFNHTRYSSFRFIVNSSFSTMPLFSIPPISLIIWVLIITLSSHTPN